MASRRARTFAAAACGTLGLLLIFTAVLTGYTRRSLFDERAFASRIANSLGNPHVAEYAAEQIADGLINARPDLVGLRPVLIGVAQGIVSSPPFRAAVRRAARLLHHSITSGQAQNIVLTVKDVGAVFESVSATSPEIAGKIPPKISATLGKLDALPEGERAAWILKMANRARTLSWTILLLGLGLCAASVRLASDPRRAIVRLGMGLVLLAILLAIAAQFGGALLLLFLRKSDLAPVVVGLAGAFLGGLMTWAIGVGIAGLVLAAGASSLMDRVPLQAWFERVRAWFTGPQPHMRTRLLRGLIAAVVGGLILFLPLPTLTVFAWLAGLVIAFAGLREAFVSALHLLPDLQPKVHDHGRTQTNPAAIGFVSAVCVALLGATAWAVLRSPDQPKVEGEPTSFNGLANLGDRTVDQVIFPTTHNSMGGADVNGWMFPNQSATIKEQLEDGVRGFLVDIHYGIPTGDAIKTVIDSSGTSLAKYEAEVGPEGMEAALRIRNRITGEERGEKDVYMCHGFCELGALRFIPMLEEMRDFLAANPGEVIVIVLQDESVSAADIERCFEESGLIDFVYRGPMGPWPTLRELAETDQRVIVMTENLKSGLPWIRNAFEVLQETPYTFHDPSQFTNRANRGGPGGTLFLLNHWIESTPMPKPSNAAIVNAHDFLLKRIRAFAKERGHIPNLVAVDFYRQGDLVAVTRELNSEPLPKAR
jgi:hypothetical protein